MKSLNEKSTLWSEVSVEAMETREEYGFCFTFTCLFIGNCWVVFGQ